MSTSIKIELNRLKELLKYDHQTGVFTWMPRHRKPQFAGKQAGCTKANGYIYINIDGVGYLAHRLAFFYATGCHPKNTIDHIDGDKKNNSIANLRDVPSLVNSQNRKKANADNKLGVLGVRFVESTHSYRAQIRVRGSVKFLGNFKTPELAHNAYISAKRIYHDGCTI